MEITIDGTAFSDVSSFYQYLSLLFGFPEWFWWNLDALYDILSDTNISYKIIWENAAISKKNLSYEFVERVLSVFHDLDNIELIVLE